MKEKHSPIEPEGLPDKKERCKYELLVEDYFGLPSDVSENQSIKVNYADLVSLVTYCMEKWPSPEPSSKEQEGDNADTISKLYSMIDYWKKRCEAAENVIGFTDIPLSCDQDQKIIYNKWQEIKNQAP